MSIIFPVDSQVASRPWLASSQQWPKPAGFSTPTRFSAASRDDLSGENAQTAKGPATTGWDILAKISLAGMVAVNVPLLFSPQISRKAEQILKTRMLEGARRKAAPKTEALLRHLADPKKLKDTFFKLDSFAKLLQLNTGYQVGINTQQPSKSLSSFSGTFTLLGMMAKPNPFINSAWSYLNSFFWFAGETNDIKNNNNPSQRREWDQKRLFPALFGQKRAENSSFFRELGSMFKFMGKDFRYALSFEPWKDLARTIRQKKDWKKPQSYQTAIGAQLNFMGFLGATAAYIAKKITENDHPHLRKIEDFEKWPERFKYLPNKFSSFTKFVMVFSIISYIPVLMRALQSKNELDGALTFVGVPLTTAGQVVRGSLSLKSLQGLFNLGSPIVNEGKRINSKKYRAQVNYLNNLRNVALANPALTAQDVLSYLQSRPDELQKMALTMGQFRVNFILDMLQAGVSKQRMQNISLADYLLSTMKMGA